MMKIVYQEADVENDVLVKVCYQREAVANEVLVKVLLIRKQIWLNDVIPKKRSNVCAERFLRYDNSLSKWFQEAKISAKIDKLKLNM